MLLAYRRGLLKPYYEHGRSSQAREYLVLRMLAQELDADAIEQHALLSTTAIAPHLSKPRGVTQQLELIQQQHDFIQSKREYKPYKVVSKQDTLISESERLIALFKKLKEDGTIEKVKAHARQSMKELGLTPK